MPTTLKPLKVPKASARINELLPSWETSNHEIGQIAEAAFELLDERERGCTTHGDHARILCDRARLHSALAGGARSGIGHHAATCHELLREAIRLTSGMYLPDFPYDRPAYARVAKTVVDLTGSNALLPRRIPIRGSILILVGRSSR